MNSDDDGAVSTPDVFSPATPPSTPSVLHVATITTPEPATRPVSIKTGAHPTSSSDSASSANNSPGSLKPRSRKGKGGYTSKLHQRGKQPASLLLAKASE